MTTYRVRRRYTGVTSRGCDFNAHIKITLLSNAGRGYYRAILLSESSCHICCGKCTPRRLRMLLTTLIHEQKECVLAISFEEVFADIGRTLLECWNHRAGAEGNEEYTYVQTARLLIEPESKDNAARGLEVSFKQRFDSR